jgi:hypothetical protein
VVTPPVQFAERLEAAHVPVSLLVTYDPNRFAHSVPSNVRRYINLYQSSNVLGSGDVAPVRGFHGNYASFNLKNRSEVIHVNLDKFAHIQEILASKIRSAGVISEGREPLHLVVPPVFRSSCGTVGLRYRPTMAIRCKRSRRLIMCRFGR